MSPSWIDLLVSICLSPSRALKARRDLAMLASLDDRGLADIGLSRQDLRDATAFGAFEDPTARLAERARERADLAAARRHRPAPPTPPAVSSPPRRDRAA